MPCFKPMPAFRNVDGTVVFTDRKSDVSHDLTLACGQCVGCRLEKSRQWAVRCMHEAQMHEENCFLTLTYNDENLPEDNSLNYDHFQDFIRKLRDHFRWHHGKTGIRFYMAGEYGEQFGRPHYHACIFGINFSDRKYHGKSPSGANLYVSKELESLWDYGYSSIGDVNFDSAAYVARYIMKKQTGHQRDEHGLLPKDHYTWCDLSTGEVHERKPEFNKMSLKPGIGAPWLQKYMPDVYPNDFIEVRGKKTNVPKYYDKIYKKLAPFEFDDLQYERQLRALEKDKNEYTPERLAAKEQVQLAKFKKLKRKLT
jgi:hypothetical protein